MNKILLIFVGKFLVVKEQSYIKSFLTALTLLNYSSPPEIRNGLSLRYKIRNLERCLRLEVVVNPEQELVKLGENLKQKINCE